MEAVAVVAIITSLGSLVAVFAKTIKKSSCCGSNCESRTPPPSIHIDNIPPTPIQSRQPSPICARDFINPDLREIDV